MPRLSLILLVAALLAAGCGKEEKPKPSGGVEIDAPGVNIKVSPDGATEVKAPGADVQVKPK